MTRRSLLATLPAAVLAQRPAATLPDWPQWHGPDRTNLSKETGLLRQWPSGGPKVVWKIGGLGTGYGSVAIVGDRIYVQGTKDNKSTVFALDRATGQPKWTAPIGRALDQDRGGGPRGTPTVEGDVLYVLTEAGDLAQVRLKDANVVWNRNILKEYGGSNPHWHISESPLIDGNKLIVTPGGRGAGIVALNKANGDAVWKSDLSDEAGYASCIVADIHGVRTYMTLTADSGCGVRASDGKMMWRYERACNGTANCTTPIYANNKVFYTSAYGTGCGLVDISKAGEALKATEVYFNKEMQNHHGGVVLVNGHLYGSSGSILTCMDFATGAGKWKERSVGKGSVTYAEGMIYYLSETHAMALVEANPAAYVEKGRFPVSDEGHPSWAHPVVCGGKLYIRNQSTLTCYDIKA
ncbi:MAG: PQQ-binding-like beta-propeller repeat protein [Bryobacteraceae bacterium]|nr:PQQ-binding-like beta-propeller repeat protein [Bryobacteraceae bacterium]